MVLYMIPLVSSYYSRVVVSTRDVGNREVAFEAPMLVCKAYVCTISISSRDMDLRTE